MMHPDPKWFGSVGRRIFAVVMLLLFVLGLLYVIVRSPRQLPGGLGLVLGYVVGMSGLCALFHHVPSPLWVRLGVLIVVSAVLFLIAKRRSFRDTTIKSVVLYFVCLTTVSGLAQWATEANREVHAKRPVIKETVISVVEDDGTTKELRREAHTYVESFSYEGEKLIDCWFNAVSAACVTGLISTDFSEFTLAGQIITLVTIQGGGLGIIFFTVIIGMLVVRGESTRTAIDQIHADALDVDPQFVGRMLRQVLIITFVLEGLGTIIMGSWFTWFADPAPLKGMNPWWWSLFHAVSAFCNAGFGLNPDNLSGFVKDPIVNFTVAGLIIMGGLGYAVIIRIWVWLRVKVLRHNGSTHKLVEHLEVVQASRIQTLIVLQGTMFLLKLGTVAPLLLDWKNPVYADLNFPQRLMACFFHSVSARTAGFNTVDLGAWSTGVLLIYIALMYIGAGPQGTAGGIKLTTAHLLYSYILNWFRAPYQHVVLRRPALFRWVNWLHRNVNGGKKGQSQDAQEVEGDLEDHWLVHRDTMSAAVRLFISSLLVLGGGVLLISLFESQYLITPDPTFNYLKVVFETTSAFGTVGLTMGYEGSVTSWAAILTDDSKIVLNLEMLIGRMGPLTILSLIPWRQYFGPIDTLQAEKLKKVQVG